MTLLCIVGFIAASLASLHQMPVGREDPLEKGMATNSNILAWRIPMDRGAWWATVQGVSKNQTGLSD